MFTSPANPHHVLRQIKTSETLVHDLAREFLGALSESSAIMEEHVRVMTSILNSLTMGLVVVDEKNDLVLTNTRAVELGVDPDSDWMTQLRQHFEFRYTEDGELIEPGTGPNVRAMVERQPQQAEVFATCEHFPQGRWFKIKSAPIIDDDGMLRGAVSLFDDVTEQVHLRKELEALDALMTHDIKNHFAAVEGLMEFIHNDSDTVLSPDALYILNEFRLANCEQLQSLNNLVHLRTAGFGAQTMVEAAVDVDTLVGTACEMVSQLSGLRKVRLEVSVDNNLPAVKIPQVAICHVLCNLLHNAIKYTTEQQTIQVTAHQDADGVTIQVADHGSGMTKQTLADLFKPKLRQSRKGDNSFSSGLGLYLCRQIVNTAGGKLWCESEPDKGTVFFLRLPVSTG